MHICNLEYFIFQNVYNDGIELSNAVLTNVKREATNFGDFSFLLIFKIDLTMEAREIPINEERETYGILLADIRRVVQQ